MHLRRPRAALKTLNSRHAIAIALYKSGLRSEMGKQMAGKWILAASETRRKNCRKMGKWPLLAHFWANFPPFFGRLAIFSPFRAGGRFGVCTGQSGLQLKTFIPATEPPDPRMVSEGVSEGVSDPEGPKIEKNQSRLNFFNLTLKLQQ